MPDMCDANRKREIQRIAQAIISAAKTHFGEGSQVDVHIDRESGDPSVSVNGQSLKKNYIGDLLGRIFARAAKQVIIQKIREVEHGTPENRSDES
jgi:transcription termination/antitermination protein NusA